MRRPILLWFCCTLLFLLGKHASSAAPLDYQVKAVYLINFTRYITWPSPTPHLVCIVNAGEVSEWLGSNAGKTGINSKDISSPKDINGCSILYLGADSTSINLWLEAAHEKGILTVGETTNFLSQGGMIQLRQENSMLRLDVNLKPARASHLQISSRLLSLAGRVEGDTQ